MVVCVVRLAAMHVQCMFVSQLHPWYGIIVIVPALHNPTWMDTL